MNGLTGTRWLNVGVKLPTVGSRHFRRRNAMTVHSVQEPEYVPRLQETVVQQRPTLGTMPRTRRGTWWWLQPAVDFASAAGALCVIAAIVQVAIFPVVVGAPLLLVGVCAAIAMYVSHPER